MAGTTPVAPSKFNLADAVISINAKSKPADKVVITCLKGEITLSKGSRDFTEEECHTGTQTFTGVLKYPEGTLELLADSMNAAAAQIMLEAALEHTGDFATDNTLQIEIELNNKAGAATKGTLITADLLIGSASVTIPTTGSASFTAGYKQLGPYTLTPSA